MDQGGGQAGVEQGVDQRAFEAAGGLDDDDGRGGQGRRGWRGPEQGHDGGDAGGVVGEREDRASLVAGQVQRIL